MAHGLNSVIKRGVGAVNCKPEGKTGIGSRRIFAPHFKLQVLDSYRNDADCKGNQRATARKYGIHRRQIQKWLQVENTLRSSVSAKQTKSSAVAEKCEMALNGNRQRDDDSCFPAAVTSASAASGNNVEPRVPALETPWPAPPAPLDFSTHGRGGHTSPVVASPSASPPCPADPAAPMDLSFKRPAPEAAGAPVPYPAEPLSPLPLPCSAASPSLHRPHPDVWDLSTKNLKRKYDDSVGSPRSQTSPKPVKLFKPYLDDIKDDPIEEAPQRAAVIVKSEPTPPCCSAVLTHATCDNSAYYYNNNNNICEVKSEYSTYTLHELQSKSYYYPYYPTPEYDLGANYCSYDESSYAVPLKQRQSYSLDFKLSAIDCYYQDSICKGNQRAVATKYNIHRRQVQKWLKQAEELRTRNESMKQMHAVR